ncbi:MAG: hypothetical protein ACLRWM_02215 [Streptococcus sp.]
MAYVLIIDNIKEVSRDNNGLIKVFFPKQEEYREQGLKTGMKINFIPKYFTKKERIRFLISINAN